MWFWALAGSAVLTAIFFVIALAQVEAGTKAKAKWLLVSFCSLAVVLALIIIKPRTNMEQVQYNPAPSQVTQNENEPKNDVAKKKTTPKATGPSDSQEGGDMSKGVTGITRVTPDKVVNQEKTVNQEKAGAKPDLKNTPPQPRGEPSIQEQLSDSLQKKSNNNGKAEYRDPVLEEILELKRQAEETGKETALGEPSLEQSSDSGVMKNLLQMMNNPEKQTVAGQQSNSSLSDNQEVKKTTESDGLANQKVVKARVTISQLNVRDKGSLDGKIVGLLRSEDIVEVLNDHEKNDWLNIRLSSGQTGWVMKRYLQLIL